MAALFPVRDGREAMEEFDFIETPENVDLQRRLAGIGSRFLAGLMDNLLIAAAILVLVLILAVADAPALALGREAADEAAAWVLALLLLVGFVLYWGYFFFFEAWMNGQTPGKRYMKIRVVQREGRPLSFDAIAIRNLLRAVDGIGGYAVAGIAMFFTQKIQRLGDLAAGTVVVSEDILDYAARQDKKRKVFDDRPATGDALAATRLTPQEHRLLRNYWLRRGELTVEARRRLLPGLLRPILQRMAATLPNDSLLAMERHVEHLLSQSDSSAEGSPGITPFIETRNDTGPLS